VNAEDLPEDLPEDLQNAARVRQGETIPAVFRRDAFHCVFCAVYTTQHWTNLRWPKPTPPMPPRKARIWICTCSNCVAESYWLEDLFDPNKSVMLFPSRATIAPAPHADMPDDVRADYEEAASIVQRSPRGAGALLRLALQELMPHLGEKGKNINDDIASLVSKGLDPGVQQALDALRVIGNNSVHPLELDLRDDVETVGALFGLINYIVEQTISHPQKLEKLYQGLPEGAREAITKRDAG
jgi:Domain of unknown function (DUF4145)